MTKAKKSALVTGAGRGLGRAIAKTLAQAGYEVGIHYNVSSTGAESLYEEIRKTGGEALLLKADLSDLKQLNAMYDTFFDRFKKIDVLVNNSGITAYMPLLEATPEHFSLLVNVDFRATYFGTQRAAKNMIAHGIHGSIVNLSSCQKELMLTAASVYGPLKAAIHRFTKHAALELAVHKIRVNCISPGHIKVTDPNVVGPREVEQIARIPWHRVGRPEEIGHAVLFLVDEKADYITGTDLQVDGGIVMPPLIDNFNFPLPPPPPKY
jgi:NAD(P)-dependent dehydrogenase (short-subunit alcohol dehydrogenase family)